MSSYTQHLLQSLKTSIKASEYKKIEALILAHAKQWSEQQELDRKTADANAINFGKYKGRTAQEVFEEDPDYIKWLCQTELGKKNPRLLQTCLSLAYPN